MDRITLEDFKKLSKRQIQEKLPVLLIDEDGKIIAEVQKSQPQW